MAQIDLAQAKVYLLDGHSAVGALNDAAGGTAADLSITVDGFSAAIPNGARLTIAGHDTIYYVVSTTGGATPTAITITPGLEDVVADDAVITVGPRELLLVVGEGNLTFSEKRAMEYVRNYRRISFVKEGDEEPTDVSFDLIWEYLSSVAGETPKPHDVFHKIKEAVDWETSGADPCEPYCIDIEVIYRPPCDDDDAEESIMFKEFRWESLDGDLKSGTLAVKGMCKITQPVITRRNKTA